MTRRMAGMVMLSMCLCAFSMQAAASDVLIACKIPPQFIPLKPGEVRPDGWLKDWAHAAAEGITGHLDERSDVFKLGYKGVPIKATGATPNGTGWPLEQCAYWLDGLVRLAYILNDQELIAKATARLDLIVDGVNAGGESFIYWQPKAVLKNRFNNWAHSHMGRALVAYYRASGDPRILRALVKVYKDYPLPEMPVGDTCDVSGAVNLDPMLETYALSGNAEILKNALAYARSTSFDKLTQKWADGQMPDCHGVTFYENVRVPALLYPWTGRKQDLDATVRALAGKYQAHGLPYGLLSAEEFMAGIGSTRHTETCNVACAAWTDLWLLRITGEGSYADRMERIFFNAAPAPISRDYQILAYHQVPNRIQVRLPGEKPRFGSCEYTRLGHGPLCCIGNSSRIIPNYIMHMWMASPDGGLAATLYGPASVQSTVAGDVPVTIDTQTDYPFNTRIQMRVRPRKSVRFPLYLRIPKWCATASVTVNDLKSTASLTANGFIRIDRVWKSDDRVVLDLAMHPEVVRGNETPFPKTKLDHSMYHIRPLAQRTEVNEPYAYVNYGPLLFALAIPDETPNKPVAGAVWNYALDVAPDQLGKQVEVTRRSMPESWRWQLEGAPIQLRIPARQFDWQPTGVQPLPNRPVEGGQPTSITLVPYGCTKFRISMFPVTAKTWGAGPLSPLGKRD